MRKNTSRELDPEWVRIGETLRTIRKTKGFHTGDFAGELEISYSYLANIEAGRKRLTPELLARAAKVLDVRQVAIVRPGYYAEDAKAS